MSKVLVVGMAVVDLIFEVESMPDACEKFVASEAQIVGGGGAANAACAIANLGGQAILAARVGTDLFGDMIVDELKRSSVDCSRIQRTEGARSSYSSVLLDSKGERQIVNFRGHNLSDAVTDIESVNPASVLADTRWNAGAIAAMKLAKDKNIPGVLDAEAPLDPQLLTLASHLAFSKQGLESIVGELNSVETIESALREVASIYEAWVAVTDGGNGVYSLNNGVFNHHPAHAVDVVDTLGAGDVWHGAFAYWLACGHNEEASVKFACVAASLKCARAGGGRSCPGIDEVIRVLA